MSRALDELASPFSDFDYFHAVINFTLPIAILSGNRLYHRDVENRRKKTLVYIINSLRRKIKTAGRHKNLRKNMQRCTSNDKRDLPSRLDIAGYFLLTSVDY